jgi:hypothetical protein
MSCDLSNNGIRTDLDHSALIMAMPEVTPSTTMICRRIILRRQKTGGTANTPPSHGV